MRITNNQVTDRAIREFATAREQMDAAQSRVTTGHRFSTASEDPSAAAQTTAALSSVRALDQYERNIGAATAHVDLEDGVLGQLTSLLTRAKEIAISGASDTVSATSRRGMAAEVNELLANAVQLANTKLGSEYLFGGDQADVPPYAVNTSGATYQFALTPGSGTGARSIAIGAGQQMLATHDGVSVFGDGTAGALKSIQSLAESLSAGDRTATAAAASTLDGSLAALQSRVAEVGARANQLDVAGTNVKAYSTQMAAFASTLQDVDLDQAMTDLVTRQLAYQAALSATAKIINLSLTDYLH